MRKIKVYGFGEPKVFDADVNDVQDAISFLSANGINVLGVRDLCFFTRTEDDIAPIPPEMLSWSLGGAHELIILPGVSGSGAEIAAAWTAFAATTAGQVVIGIAVNIAISYVLQSLQETPITENAKPNQTSTLFNAPRNISAQGMRVPLGYGRFRVGGVTVNKSFRHADLPIGQTDDIVLLTMRSAAQNIFVNDIKLSNPLVQKFTVRGVEYNAGQTAVLSVVDVSLAPNGDLLITSKAHVEDSFTIEVQAVDDLVSIPQQVKVRVNMDLDVWKDEYTGGA